MSQVLHEKTTTLPDGAFVSAARCAVPAKDGANVNYHTELRARAHTYA
jgi:hypothetical protein